MIIKSMFGLLIVGLFVLLFRELRKQYKIEDNESDLKEDLKDAKLDLRKHSIKSDVLDVEEDSSKIEAENIKRETKLRK